MSLWKLLTARWGSGAGETDEIRIGASTNSLNIVDYAHHEIHGGSGFTMSQTSSDMSAGNIGFRFSTPNTTKRIHMLYSAYTAEDGIFTIYEGGTPAGGGAVTPLNRRRDSATVSTLTSVFGGAVTTGGVPTTLQSHDWGLAGGPGSLAGAGAGGRSINEWVLNQNTSYHVILSGTSASPGWIELDWYEHTDQH